MEFPSKLVYFVLVMQLIRRNTSLEIPNSLVVVVVVVAVAAVVFVA